MQTRRLCCLLATGMSSLGIAQAPLDWLDRPATSAPSTRNEGAVVYDMGRSVVVRFGGYLRGANVTTNETWELQGFQWTQRFPPVSPLARSQSAAAYDPVSQCTLLYGGWNGGTIVFGDTWAYNGTNWTQLFPATVPPATHEHAMAYDTARNVIVMFGGITSGGITNATWEFANGTWTQMIPGTSPPPRYATPMVYDAARACMVVHSGTTSAVVPFSLPQDTWEYNGATWTQITTGALPIGRCEHSMAYDMNRNRVVMYGGAYFVGNTLTFLGDTWEYDGTNWTQVAPAHAPLALWGINTVFDSRWNLVVRVGSQWPGSNTVGYFGRIITASGSMYGTACPGPTAPMLSHAAPRIGVSNLTATVLLAPGNSVCAWGLAVGTPTPTPVGPCTLYLPASAALSLGTTNGSGMATFTYGVPDLICLMGLPLVSQAFVLNPASPIGFDATAATALTVGL